MISCPPSLTVWTGCNEREWRKADERMRVSMHDNCIDGVLGPNESATNEITKELFKDGRIDTSLSNSKIKKSTETIKTISK